MSYTVAIVLPPLLGDDAEAWAALEGWVEQTGSRPGVFQDLHDRLTAQYPCVCSVPEQLLETTVWSDGPLIDNFQERVAVLGILFDRVEEVLPFVIANATDLGLTVFDWQTEDIHRPEPISTASGSPVFQAPRLAASEWGKYP